MHGSDFLIRPRIMKGVLTESGLILDYIPIIEEQQTR